MDSSSRMPSHYVEKRAATLADSATPGIAPIRIVIGVAGGIAAYKTAHLVRLFKESGHHVHVVPTKTALEFVGKATWEALSGNPVYTEVFEGTDEVMHVRLGREADLVVVAPATADLLARAVGGRADDMLTATLLTTTKPVLFAPAMHTEMWLHPATQHNVSVLRDRGGVVLNPAVGRLTGKDTGAGRLPEPEEIFAAAQAVLRANINGDSPQDLAGWNVAISAGGTREALDPVRFLGNRSTGHQGWALAQAAAGRGANVRLIAANVDLATPHGVDRRDVESARELRAEMDAAADWADVVVMAAAVADYRPVASAETKQKKAEDGSAPTIELEQNPDILAGLVQARAQKAAAASADHAGVGNAGSDSSAPVPGPEIIIGFAAETGDESGSVLDHARKKAKRKGADLLVVNQVGANIGFGNVDSAVTVLTADGEVVTEAAGTKDVIAHAVWDAIHVRRPG